jgi:DNA-binding Xre family transcriptional regulator
VSTASRFDYVALAGARKILVCKLVNGGLYELPFDAFVGVEDWDDSGIGCVDLIDGGHGALLVLNSGNKIDFAPDFVLHHCEPSYRYYRGKARPSAIGARIREIRTAKGLTMKELEAKTGIREPNLSRLEADKHVPRIETLSKIARALNIPLTELLGVRLGVPAGG